MIVKIPNVNVRRILSLREKVYKAVREGIFLGDIPPGARIVETRIAK